MPNATQILIVAALVAFVLVLLRSGGRGRARGAVARENANELTSKNPAAEVNGSEPSVPGVARIEYDEEDEDSDPTRVGAAAERPLVTPPTLTIVYDEDAAQDEPTHSRALILVTATGQTDTGLRRKNNEDAILALDGEGVFVVADGMGGYRGGEIASQLAVDTIERAFKTGEFQGAPHDSIPRRASELARAIQMANDAILAHAAGDRRLAGMGTTICAARFSQNKQRLYVGHVGDSRLYRLRNGQLRQMTSDHTMRDLGVAGEGAGYLSRAIGIRTTVPIDIVLGKPQPGDLYVLCSDGLTKMVDDETIRRVLVESPEPRQTVDALIKLANENGGKDNITVVLVRVDEADDGRPRKAA